LFLQVSPFFEDQLNKDLDHVHAALPAGCEVHVIMDHYAVFSMLGFANSRLLGHAPNLMILMGTCFDAPQLGWTFDFNTGVVSPGPDAERQAK
jgi:hypothetical protein